MSANNYGPMMNLDRQELIEKLVEFGEINVMARALSVTPESMSEYIRRGAKRTRQARIDEGLDLLALGLHLRTAASFAHCGTGALLEARDGAARPAPPLSHKDRAADAAHIAKWGHV